MTTADGWSIIIGSHSNNRLATVDNSGMVGAVPATPDRSDGTYTLDLTGTITDSADPSITYTLYKIGFYAFNGCSTKNIKIGKIIFPDTLVSWSMGPAVAVFGRNASTYLQVEPKNFTAGITWSGGNFALDINDFDGELHLNGATSVSKLTQTVGRIMPVFIYPTLQTINANTFANLKNTPRYLMYVMQGVEVLAGLPNTSYQPGIRCICTFRAEMPHGKSGLRAIHALLPIPIWRHSRPAFPIPPCLNT